MKTLILGIGNLLLGDEGVGVHAAQALMKLDLPEEVTVLDIGTAILDALLEIEKADRIIVMDAVKADEKPGSIYRMPLEDFVQKPCIASMHGFDLSRVLALAQRVEPPEVIVFGIEPARMDWSMELSQEVRDSLPLMIDAVLEEIRLK
jgi:hydrogenase maturation protease